MVKRMKDRNDTVNGSPGRIEQAHQLGQFAGLPAAQPGGFACAQPAGDLANNTTVRRTVMISGMRQVGMISFDLLVEFELTVMPDGLPPYPATTQQTISQLQIGQLRPGMTLQAAVHPANPTAVWLDLSSIR
jgi:hypothetical protein